MDHAAGFSAYRIPPRSHGRAISCSIPTANVPCTPRSIRRSVRARTSRRLWQAVLDRKIDWIVSDHACCSAEQKWSKDDPSNIWLAKSGFGGTEYLLSGVLSEGSKRGMSYNHMAELLSWKPAQRFGLASKGDIAPGYRCRYRHRRSAREFRGARRRIRIRSKAIRPFEGVELSGRVKEHLPARRACLRQRQRCRAGARQISAPARSLSPFDELLRCRSSTQQRRRVRRARTAADHRRRRRRPLRGADGEGNRRRSRRDRARGRSGRLDGAVGRLDPGRGHALPARQGHCRRRRDLRRRHPAQGAWRGRAGRRRRRGRADRDR